MVEPTSRTLRFLDYKIIRILGLLALIFSYWTADAQSNCIPKKPHSPFYFSIDTLCSGDPSPQLSTLLKSDSATFNLQWATDTLNPGTYSTTAPIIPNTPKNSMVFVRQFRISNPLCTSYFLKLSFVVLPKPIGIPTLKSGNQKISVCEGYSVNLNDSVQSSGGYNLHWYALDSLGNTVPFSGKYTNAKYTGRDTLFYVQYSGNGLCFGSPLIVDVAVLPKPVLKVNPILGFTICDSLPIPFNALDAHTGYKPSYDWYVNGVLQAKNSGGGYTIKAGTYKAGTPVKVNYVVHIDRFAPYYHCDSVGPPFSSDTVSIRILPKPQLPGPIQGPYIVYAGQQNQFYQVRLDTTLAYKWRFSNPNQGILNYANNTATVSYSDTLNFSSNKEIIDTLTLIVQNVCDSTKESLVIYIRPYLKPINILTPNGDNINDTWIINNIDNQAYTQNLVMVYDRFGNLVFKQQNYTNSSPWNGSHNGTPLSEGTYYYIIQYQEDTFTKILKGYINILRGR